MLDEQGKKAPTCAPDTICVGLERSRHVAQTIDYLAHFRDREPDLVRMGAPPMRTPYEQVSWLDMRDAHHFEEQQREECLVTLLQE